VPSDTTSALLGLLLQGTGNNDNTWGQLLNEQTIQLIENAIAGRTAKTVTGGSATLTATEQRSAILDFSGTLGSNEIITVANTSKTWQVNNGCVLGAFSLTMKTSGGSAVTIPSGKWTVWCDGANGVYVAASAALVALGSLTPAADKIAYFTSASAAALADLSTFARTILDDANAAAVLTTIGAQPLDSDLTTIAANITAAGHALLDDANAAAQRTTLGLGTAAIVNTGTSGATIPLLNGDNTFSGANVFSSALKAPLLHMRDVQTSGTAPAAIADATWQAVRLTDETVDDIGVTLASNTWTLPAGTYEIEADVPVYYFGSGGNLQDISLVTQLRLQNTTAGTTVVEGMTLAMRHGNSQNIESGSGTLVPVLRRRFTVAASQNLQLQVYADANSHSVLTQGKAASLGTEIYAECRITRISA
jgi:hypothetical protein